MSSMTPSATGITDGQIDKAVSVLRDQLRKHGESFSVDAVQQVLGQDELGPDLLTVFRKRVEAVSNMIVRPVTVNRSRTPQDMLDATGRNQYTDKGVVKAMPRGYGDTVDVYFFKLDLSKSNGYISCADLAKEYALRGLVPDPYAQTEVNIDDPSFADEHPNATQWQDGDGKYCYACFDRWRDGRRVNVYQYGYDWNDYW